MEAEPRNRHDTISAAFFWPKLVTKLSPDFGSEESSWTHGDRSVQGAGVESSWTHSDRSVQGAGAGAGMGLGAGAQKEEELRQFWQ